MIQKSNRTNNDVFNEMLTVLASNEHKQKFAQDADNADVTFETQPIQGNTLKDRSEII